jgi:hypothetical protein
MVKYRTFGSNAQDQLGRLTASLARHGAEETSNSDPELLLVCAESVSDAAALLESIEPSARSRVLLVGVVGELDVRRPPTEGTLAGLLERYRPLGAMMVAEQWRPDLAGFIGAKDLAENMNAGFAKQFSSRHYATWLRCAGDDAGDFVLKLVAETTRSPT